MQSNLQGLPEDAVCAAAHGMVGIGLGSTLLVFAENCSTLVWHLPLPHSIDTLLWLGSPHFLVATDRSGQLHFLHVASQRCLISTQLPIGDSGATYDAFTAAPTILSSHYNPMMDGSTTLLFISSKGLVIRVENMNLEFIEEALAESRFSDLAEAKAQLRLETCSKLQFALNTNTTDVMEGTMESYVGKLTSTTALCGSASQQLYIYAATEDGRILWYQFCEDDPEEVFVSVLLQTSVSCSKLLLAYQGRYLVMLMSDGSVILACTSTGLHKSILSSSSSGQAAVDVVLLPWTDTEMHPQLLLLSSSALDPNNHALKIVSLPGLDKEYELPVNKGSILVSLGEALEAMIFLEPDAVSSLKVKTIIDGVPETRLRKLISKHKFSEAYEFAKVFGLDTSLVAKSKARILLSQLNPNYASTFNTTLNNSVNATTETLLEQLLKILDTIEDVVFVGAACIETALPDLPTTQTLLKYAAERLASTSAQKCDDTDQLREEVGKLQHRLTTFLCLYPSHVDISVWESFSSTSPLELCLEHLSAGDLSISSCVWQRHQHEFSESVDYACVERILQCIPSTLSSTDVVAWLPHNVMDFLRLCPMSLSSVIDWVMAKMKRLESREKKDWPDNAICVGNAVMAAIDRSGVDTCSVVEGGTGVPSLRVLLRCLDQLRTLLRVHRLRVPLQQYMQSDAASVCCSVLQWLVCGEEVSAVVLQFLLPVICEGSRSVMDEVLQQFVVTQLSDVHHQEWSLASEQATLWEDKLHAVSRAVQDEQVSASS